MSTSERNPEVTATTAVPFDTTDLDALRTLDTARLEQRLAIHRNWTSPLRYRTAIKAVLAERASR
jgi:hypothetical protein